MDRALRSCVSVVDLSGMRLRIRILIGLISWDRALFSSITNILSCSRMCLAGRLSAILIGIFCLLIYFENYDPMNSFSMDSAGT